MPVTEPVVDQISITPNPVNTGASILISIAILEIELIPIRTFPWSGLEYSGAIISQERGADP